MRILVSEFVCGGGWRAGDLPASLAAEGRAMCAGLIADLLADPLVEVVTTWDARLEQIAPTARPRLTVHRVDVPGQDWPVCLTAARECDAAIVIAPETDGVLYERCGSLSRLPLQLLNCPAATIAICADKWQTFQHCQSWSIPTIPSFQLDTEPNRFPVVVKLRDGAGSQQMQLVNSREEWEAQVDGWEAERFLWQPYVEGRALSIAGLFHHGKLQIRLPVAEQILSADGSFRYLGGIIPAEGINEKSCRQLAEQVTASLPFHGYVGFDLLWPEGSAAPCLVEINPRLCSSFLGYRQLYGPALAGSLFRGGPLPDQFCVNRCEFAVEDFAASSHLAVSPAFASRSL